MSFKEFLGNQWLLIITGIVTMAATASAFLWSKHPWRWVLGLVVLVLAAAVFVFMPVPARVDRLPFVFSGPALYRTWVFVLALALLFASTHLVTTLLRSFFGIGEGTRKEESRFADVDDAWNDLIIQLISSPADRIYDVAEQVTAY